MRLIPKLVGTLAGPKMWILLAGLSFGFSYARVYAFRVVVDNAAAGGFVDRSLLAPTPPMGWNSWDSYGRSITEADIKANADWMAGHLKRFGWQYVVIDEGWYLVN